ncbi:MAG: NAD(P)H-dependent glycerol-3-phosphate dehydrogenase [Actinobacteria bacterium]|nr:NAD(P)H-dependent glycerol-3-phosphate dehydrogenase [Actinomycetota bacterium]MBV9256308.1 NAD(P)H-dependent glycerol-3-phosphate dehydrogenase [Actinomycetota bacterium]MBV9663093.1 NAD(P)H-dependent glycerol-3-phosphate dehydrogenase [Actinomycetota bacterium]
MAVIGAGSWGTAVAAIACHNAPTVLWARRKELADEITTDHVNSSYLADYPLPEALGSSASLEEALTDADVVIMGVPSHGFRAVLAEGKPFITDGVPVLSLSKGVEQDTLLRMTEVIGELLPGHPAGVLTGPNLAKEIMSGMPALSVVALEDGNLAAELQGIFATPTFRVYTNTDVVGCEVAGALKNVMAIAAGMADGMGFGDNTKAALITRGLAELTRLGIALGGQPLTFSGLAGMGDLVATCMSRQSRNRYVGEELGKGRSLDDIIAEMNMVAEGVKTSRAVVALARSVDVEMPIAEEVVAVVNGDKKAAEVIAPLMERERGHELQGIADI